MRIAIVSDYFLDYVGGAQTSMLQQRLALLQAGHEVVLVSATRERGRRFQVGAEGLRIRPLFTLPGVELPVIPNNTTTTDALETYFRKLGVEVVHVQTEFGLAHAAAHVARRMGIRVIHTVHTFYWASDGGWHAPLAPVLRSALTRFTRSTIPRLEFTPRPVDNLLRNVTLGMALAADAVVSPSAHQAADLQKAGVVGPIAVVPNPIADSPRPPVPLTAELAAEPRFLWVARCEAVKRPLVFAEAAIKALERTGNGFSVDFVGDGSELPALRRLAEGHPNIRVHGSLPHERVLDLMDGSAAVVLTSLGFDNQPMTIAEAVSRERGVLYCDPKLIEGLGQAGFLSTTPDADGLADALVALANEPSRLVELSQGAARDHALFSAAAYVTSILRAYVG
ncbi:glycosyltransferase family 4 protein [Homoserinimonas sp. A520]